jgi:U3 small nucleolar RNA-associated protein 19
MLEAELSKDVKKIPVVEYEIPKKIFMKHEADSGLEDSLLVKLWTFK